MNQLVNELPELYKEEEEEEEEEEVVVVVVAKQSEGDSMARGGRH